MATRELPAWKLLGHSLQALSPADRVVACSVAAIAGPFVRILHAERALAAPEPAVFAFNHNNYLEALLVPAFLVFLRNGRKTGFVVDWMFAAMPLVGSLVRRTDPIPVFNKRARIPWLNAVKRRNTEGSVLERCLERLRAGRSVGIFPEGTRNPDRTTLLPARRGLGMIVLASGAPVVPVGIEFTGSGRRKGVPGIGPFVIRIGEYIDFSDETSCMRSLVSDVGRREKRKLEGQMAALVSHRIMTEIAALCGKAYPYPPGEPPACIRTEIARIKGGLSCHS